ncbi:hypothetical protein BHM03_00002240 [Ensete ventricosum]|nr:hypothetical protein BHM03_00002240 [Ensete ventricosum]
MFLVVGPRLGLLVGCRISGIRSLVISTSTDLFDFEAPAVASPRLRLPMPRGAEANPLGPSLVFLFPIVTTNHIAALPSLPEALAAVCRPQHRSRYRISLMVTHDDYSLLSRLPKDRTSVVTIFRDPVDRQNGVQRDTRELGRPRKIKEITNPYDMEEIVMPLHEFINDPMAHEIIHNGATFQVRYIFTAFF